MIRLADVLLMGAELYLDNDLSQGTRLLRTGSKRALASRMLPHFNQRPNGLDLIYHERRVEFAGEGIRYWDFLRRV